MGELVATAVVAHQPMIMVPEAVRVELGGTGADTTLIEPGFRLLRERLAALAVDTLVIVDTHWFTTTEHVLAGAEHFQGLYTSEEMPRNLCDFPYEHAGAPELAKAWHRVGKARGLHTLNVTAASLPQHYATLNVVHHVCRGQRVLSCGVVQTGSAGDNLALGEALAEAVKDAPGRVAVLGSGGMSHRFWPIEAIREHFAYDASHLISDEARAMDAHILALWAEGDHAAVLELVPEYAARYAPEGRFAHYLLALGAMGGAACTVVGRQLSAYENAVGTGQVHVLFELPPGGTRP